jgi:hypothetical protein
MEGINVFLKILNLFFYNDFDLIFGVLTPLSAISWRAVLCRSGEVYSIQHYVIKFVIDLRQVYGYSDFIQQQN